MTPNGSNDTVTLEIIRASEVTPREVKWLWYPYIPFGKITLLQGDPGDGKSKFMLALSALLTDGKPLPFQEVEEATGARVGRDSRFDYTPDFLTSSPVLN